MGDYNLYKIYSKNAISLDISERTYQLKGMGHSNIWYGNSKTDAAVCNYIQSKDCGLDDRINIVENDSLEGQEKEVIVKVE